MNPFNTPTSACFALQHAARSLSDVMLAAALGAAAPACKQKTKTTNTNDASLLGEP